MEPKTMSVGDIGLPDPEAPEVEQAVLGALILIPEAWNKVADILRPELFRTTKHLTLYQTMAKLREHGRPTDLLTMAAQLRNDGELTEIGGAVYLTELTGKVASSANIEYHSRILIEQHILRSLIRIGHQALKEGYGSADAFDLLDRVSVAVTDLYAGTQSTKLIHAASGLGDLTDGASAKHYTFGIPELDQMAVFEAGLPHVFAGRPGLGKSILCLEICWHLTQLGNVLLFSPEMTKRQIQARIVSRESGVPYRDILRKTMDAQQLEDVSRVAMSIAGRMENLKIDPTSGISPKQMRVRTERAMKTDGVIAFAVDHLHKMTTGDIKLDRSDYDRVSQCMSGASDIAKSTMLPGLIMCQFNRAVEQKTDKRPGISDLRGSGRIEEDAAMIGLMYREGYYQEQPPWEDTLEIMVAKNRDGAVGLARCQITPALSRIGASPFQHPQQRF